jgi:hypothetical protein
MAEARQVAVPKLPVVWLQSVGAVIHRELFRLRFCLDTFVVRTQRYQSVQHVASAVRMLTLLRVAARQQSVLKDPLKLVAAN